MYIYILNWFLLYLSCSCPRGGKEDILSRFVILNFIIAGRDTSANTLTWFFYVLCKNPSLQGKVSEDVRKATGCKGHASANEFAELITEEALEKKALSSRIFD